MSIPLSKPTAQAPLPAARKGAMWEAQSWGDHGVFGLGRRGRLGTPTRAGPWEQGRAHRTWPDGQECSTARTEELLCHSCPWNTFLPRLPVLSLPLTFTILGKLISFFGILIPQQHLTFSPHSPCSSALGSPVFQPPRMQIPFRCSPASFPDSVCLFHHYKPIKPWLPYLNSSK